MGGPGLYISLTRLGGGNTVGKEGQDGVLRGQLALQPVT